MSGRVEWHGDEALAHVRALAAQRLTRAAIAVARRAKELLSVPGTAVATGIGHAVRVAAKKAHAATVAENRAFAKRHNEAHRLAIEMGELKKLRVAKAGHLTDRAKAGSKKVYYKNVGGKMVKRKRKKG